MKHTLNIKWKIGQKLKLETGLVTIIGYNHVEGRGLQYICMRTVNGEVKWDYLHEFELNALLK